MSTTCTAQLTRVDAGVCVSTERNALLTRVPTWCVLLVLGSSLMALDDAIVYKILQFAFGTTNGGEIVEL